MTPHLTWPHVWHRSSYSTGANNCVECAPSDAGGLAVRDSKEVTRPHLLFSADAWTSFVSALRADAPTH
ncbi:DUF397 domain-containing protein [Streptomyces sp. NPDC057539]|uniref:DUF397 domain-containing protein n=1 Tax=Streptomyces sp. NPDC057539 TaxID=3346159 RepID=UPI0036C00CE8